MLPLLEKLIPTVAGILDKVIPDPNQAAEAKLKLLEMTQRGDLALLDADKSIALQQIEINKLEAQQGPFRGGWRPAAGWVCVCGFAYDALARPLLPWALRAWGHPVDDLPSIDTGALLALLGALLGLGGFRTIERVRGKV